MFDVWHLGLPARNLEESVRFYVKGLGFELLGYYDAPRYRVAFARESRTISRSRPPIWKPTARGWPTRAF